MFLGVEGEVNRHLGSPKDKHIKTRFKWTSVSDVGKTSKTVPEI